MTRSAEKALVGAAGLAIAAACVVVIYLSLAPIIAYFA